MSTGPSAPQPQLGTSPQGAAPQTIAVSPPPSPTSWLNNRFTAGLLILLVTAIASLVGTLFTRLHTIESNIKTLTDANTKLDELRVSHETLTSNFQSAVQKLNDHIVEIDNLRAKVAACEVANGKFETIINANNIRLAEVAQVSRTGELLR